MQHKLPLNVSFAWHGKLVPELKCFKNFIFNQQKPFPNSLSTCFYERVSNRHYLTRQNRFQRLSSGDNHKNLSPVTWKADEREKTKVITIRTARNANYKSTNLFAPSNYYYLMSFGYRANGGGVVKLVYFPFGNKNVDYRVHRWWVNRKNAKLPFIVRVLKRRGKL